MDVGMTIGDRVKQHRTMRGWTQDDLSAKSGLSITSVQRAERGNPVAAETISSLAAAFDLEAIDLIDPDPRAGEPYLPLRVVSGGRDLNAILAFSERLDFDFAELDDLEQAALIERFQAYCTPGGPNRIPSGAVDRVAQEIAGKTLLKELETAGLRVTGATFEINAAEVDDDFGGGLPICMAQWQEGCAVLRISTNKAVSDRAYVMDNLGKYESPIGSDVVFPQRANDTSPSIYEAFSSGDESATET